MPKLRLLPIGLGAKGGDFNKIMQDTLTRIVLKNEDIKTVLNDQATQLNALMTELKAPCWSPDPPSAGKRLPGQVSCRDLEGSLGRRPSRSPLRCSCASKLESALPYSLLAPTLIFVTLLIVIPIFQAFLLAFQSADGSFTLANFQKMANDTSFADALKFTFLLLIFIVPAQVVLALVMALLIHTRFKGHTIFLYIYAIPLAISDLAAGIAWLSIFTERGYLNSILNQLGHFRNPLSVLVVPKPAGDCSAPLSSPSRGERRPL